MTVDIGRDWKLYELLIIGRTYRNLTTQMEARIQGEIHGYDDFESALDDPLSSYDALLVEGRSENIEVDNLSMGYTLFLMGYVPVMKMNSGDDLEPLAEEAGVGYHDDIDADVETIYQEMTSPLIRALAFLFLIAALWSALLSVPFLVERLSLPISIWIFGTFLISLLAIFGIPMVFTSCLGVVSPGCLCGGLRDDYMAEQVNSVADENGYERVVVQCGQSHVAGIAESLEDYGWDVDLQRSPSLLGRLLRLLWIPLTTFCRAIGFVVLRLPGGKPPHLRDDD